MTPQTPIACNLSSAELAQREQTVVATLFAQRLATQELSDGYAFQFPGDAMLLAQLAEFVAFERQCCPFFTFALVCEPNLGPIWLQLRGSEGVKEFIRNTFETQGARTMSTTTQETITKTHQANCCEPSCCQTEAPAAIKLVEPSAKTCGCDSICCSDSADTIAIESMSTPSLSASSVAASDESLKQQVLQRYGQFAERLLTLEPMPVTAAASCCGSDATASASSCCGTGDVMDENAISRALNLYTPAEIRDLPPEVAEATLGCGNPHAIASLKAGETVLDLGSGAGLDCFLAARQVGENGHVIGLDMTDNMLALARRNQQKVGLSNVEFRKGVIEQMPVESASVDVIISNCVINLSTDKDAVFREAFRVLKPGGRFAVSDMVTRGEIPAEFRNNPQFWSGCLSGALDEQDYLQRLRNAGFVEAHVANSAALPADKIVEWADNAVKASGAECCTADLPNQVQGKVVSAKIWALKSA